MDPTETSRPSSGCMESVVMAFLLETTPHVAVLLEKLIGFLRTPAAGDVFGHRRRRVALVPGLLDVVDEAPCLLHLVATGEERGIASHRIKQETFIGLRATLAEAGGVMEIHLHRLQAQAGAGDLRDHAQRD